MNLEKDFADSSTDTIFPNGAYPQRGEIYYVSSGETGSTGSEQWSDRHGLIVSSDYENCRLSTVQIVYITTKPKPVFPTYIDISTPGLHRIALCNQVMTVDISRLISYKCYLNGIGMTKIDRGIMLGLGLSGYVKHIQRKEVSPNGS